MRAPQFAITIIFSVLLAACSGESADSACTPAGDNLLQDPDFATVFGPPRQRRWSPSEHAAGRSFEYETNGGELLVRKTLREPWFIMTQNVDPAAIAGKRVTFSAEIKLDLQQAPDHSFTPGGGLTLLARKGGRTLVNSSLEHEPRLGTIDWTPVAVTVEIPRGTDYVRAGFLHQADGTLQVRQPSLRVAKARGCDN